MKKIIVFASALALSGGVSYAMEEVDKDMMMEVPAPSVTVGASGKIGIKNVDDDANPDAESLQLVRAYKVTFDSSGTTDGGLMFGAGMSIRDDTGEEDMPVVKGSYVYVGGADGAWKLQFGGNDPGIDLAGGIGIADDKFGGEGDASIALSGGFEGATFRFTMADPQAMGDSEDDWSAGASYAINDISVGIGMDSEKGLAIGVGTELSGVGVKLYYSKAELKDVDLDADGEATLGDADTADGTQELGTQKWGGLGVSASIAAGEGATFSVAYSTLKLEQMENMGDAGAEVGETEIWDGTATNKRINVDFSYDLGGGATLNAGIQKDDIETIAGGNGVDGDDNEFSSVTSSDKTELSATIAFSF